MKRISRLFRNLKFQNKLLLSFLLVVLFPLSAWGIFSYRQINDALLQQTETAFRDICISAVEEWNSAYQRLDTAFSTLAGNSAIGRIINADYESGYQKYYDLTHIYDPNVETICAFSPEIVKIHVYTERDIKGVRKTFHDLSESLAEHKSLLEVTDVSNIWLVEDGRLFVARRVFDPYVFSRSAIIAAEMDFGSIMEEDILQGIDSCSFFIRNASGEVIYGAAPDVSVQTEQRTARNGILYFEDSLYPDGWTLVMQVKTQNVLVTSTDWVFRSALWQIGIAMLFPIFIIPFLTHIMVKRIEVLNGYLKRVAKEGFREDISSDDRDEIGLIINSVGEIVREMRRLIDEVYESQLQQKKAEIKALQAQINPHFLYNTLSAVNWQAIKSKNDDISKIVTALSAFYRSTLNGGQSITSVQQELETVRAYLEIQQRIHPDTFNVTYEVDDSLLEYNMPGIILQPIVENAIEHGIRMNTNGQKGSIRIAVRKEEHDILFEICDNGPGIPEESLHRILHDDRRGYGVKNVNQRLKLFFGSQYGLTFRSTGGNGTCVLIRIPQYVELESLKEMP